VRDSSLPTPVARPRIETIDTTGARLRRTSMSGNVGRPVAPGEMPPPDGRSSPQITILGRRVALAKAHGHHRINDLHTCSGAVEDCTRAAQSNSLMPARMRPRC
jgi:hypothetical protein